MAVNSLYNIVDSYFVAKLSDDAMTALALVYPAQNLVTAVAVGFGVGINANAAFHLGAENESRANAAATQGIALSFFHGILLTLLYLKGMPAFLSMFSSDPEVLDLALAYSNRAFLFAAVITVGIAFEKIFQAVGRMKVSMFSMMIGFIANIVLDPLMIFGIGPFPFMGISGAAYATGIGQCITLLAYILFYIASPIQLKIQRSHLRSPLRHTMKLYAVGIPAALNMALPSLLVSVLNGILASFSGSYVLVLGVYYKLQTFIYLTANGIVQGIRPLIGYNYGAGEHLRVRRIYRTALKLTMVVMLAGAVLSWLMPEALMGFFTSSAETVQIGVTALHIISLGFIVSAISVTSSGSLEGAGKGMPSLFISLSRYVIVMIPAALILSRFFGAEGVWAAFCATEFITAGISLLIYKKEMS